MNQNIFSLPDASLGGASLGALLPLFLPRLCLFPVPKEPTRESESLPPLSPEELLHARLDEELRNLSVRGFERLIARLLRASGYEDVRVLRDHTKPRRSRKGRTDHGGADLTASLRAEFGVTPVLVQVKQYERPVSRRFVDELRGALLRTQARQGLLITTREFAPAARAAAVEDHIGPIHLLDGQGLRDLLITHRLGLRRSKRGHLVLRPRFFRRLDKALAITPRAR